jgi:DNA/RNA endonuclease YhcR with UshA esterase domain
MKPKNLQIKKNTVSKPTAPNVSKKSTIKPKKAKDLKTLQGEITFENNVLNSQTTQEESQVVEKKLTKISAANAKAEKYYK